MVLKKKILVAVFVALALGCSLAQSVGADVPALELPIVYEGYVYIDVRPDFTGGILEMYARRGSEFVRGLVVKLEDRIATNRDSSYNCRYEGLRPAAGSTVTVSIQKSPIAPRLRAETLRVTGTMPAWLGITSPRDGSTITAAGARTLDVTWSGDHPPYVLAIREVGSRRLLLKAEAIAGTSYSVPMGTFTPGTKYKLQLLGKEHKMLFSAPVGGGSTFKLAQFHAIVIAIE